MDINDLEREYVISNVHKFADNAKLDWTGK